MSRAEQLRALPERPGVYLFKDSRGNVLYVGKAASLRHRVRAYFTPGADLTPKHQKMVARVADLDFMVTDSEPEAIILECNLIKRYRPRYNVRLKDDKNYPYLKIDLSEEWPRIYITRRWEQDASRYFGPFASARSVRVTLDVLKKLFPFRSCTKKISGAIKRACIEYDIHRCLGPCLGTVSKEEYDQTMKQVILFLEGKDDFIKRQLKKQMGQAAQRLEFERAALYRDQLQAVEKVTQRQKISSALRGDLDLIGFAHSADLACVQVFFIRQGKLLGKEAFLMEGSRDEEPSQIMTGFIKQFYGSTPNIAPLVLLQYPVEETPAIATWLAERRQGKVKLQVPQRGEKKQLVDLVVKNAKEALEHYRIKQLATPEALNSALEELEAALQLPRLPNRVECYDISNIQGRWAVGSLVVFEEGRPKPNHYRRFRIKTVGGADDYAMLQEVLRRRFQRSDGFHGQSPWATLPDLILIDGGKGQLNAALEAVTEAGLQTVPVASIAKEEEEIYLPQAAAPLRLPPGPALYLLQRIRDEAHRFAISYHIKVRRQSSLTSALDQVPGIGPRRKRALLRAFGSVQRIKEAPEKDIASVPGLTLKLAQKLKQFLG